MLRTWRSGRPWLDAASVLFCGYVAMLPLLHVTALRNLFLYGSLIAALGSLARREGRWPRAEPAVLWLLGYALVAVAVLFASQVDVARSLKEVRGELLVQLYILWFCMYFLAAGGASRTLLLALASGFGISTLVLVILLGTAMLGSEPLTIDFHLRDLVPGFGLDAQFYLPLVVGMLAALPLSAAWRAALGLTAVAGFALAIAYNATSGVVFVALSAAFVAAYLLRARRRVKTSHLIAFGAVAVLATGFVLKDEGARKIAEQFKMVEQGRYYELLSLRVGMWDIAVDCAKDAPWHGYGYGQKKVALVCSDEAYLAPARERGNFMWTYYDDEDYGGVSLHNQYLENWLIAGWVGALLWIAFFVATCRTAWRKRAPDGIQQLVVLPVLLVFLAGCFFNGLWEGPPMAKGIMVILALALARQPGMRAKPL